MTTKDKRVIIVGFFTMLFALFPAIVLIYIVINLKPLQVAGVQMEPAIMNNDKILIRRRFKEIERNDIIVYEYTNTQGEVYPFISRIVGIPGNTVTRSGSEIILTDSNEQLITKVALNDSTISLLEDNESIIIGSNEYFVLGDNRDQSLDSRFKQIGLIQREEVIGIFLTKYQIRGYD